MSKIKLPMTGLRGPFRALIDKLRLVVRRVTVKRGPDAAGRPGVSARPAPEVFYRAMSEREFHGLAETGRLTVRSESFVTQDSGFVKQLAVRHPKLYQVTVRFEMEPGTKQALHAAGRRSGGKLLDAEGLGNLPWISKGMTDVVHVKAELEAVTYGLRRGSAAVFNSRILKYGVEND